jgi:excisionase family DNA binding protein
MASTHYLTVKRAAERLHLSRWTIRDKARRKELPHRKPPGTRRLLFSIADLEAFEDGGELEYRKWGKDGRIVTVKR